MLMRFSGEDMGEYTTLPEVFKADKDENRKKLNKWLSKHGQETDGEAEDDDVEKQQDLRRQATKNKMPPGYPPKSRQMVKTTTKSMM